MFAACPAWGQKATANAKRSPVPVDINDRFLDPELAAEDFVKRWEVESREVFACRAEVVEALKLTPGMRIADVGAGTGLFIGPFSEAVGEKGKVYAVDISPRFLELIKRRTKEEKLDNVDVLLSEEKAAKLPPRSVDVVFLSDTYHHFEYHVAMLRSIRKALAGGGRLAMVEFERIPGKSREFILGHVRAGKEEFRKEIEDAGFVFREEVKISGFKENYFLIFEKPKRQPASR
ncbi:MAG: class I SAM-dependent methyltransferase [Planctomycetes bacterium]|nr:class I SAM-dependent methyltransferase [Planctomycetota bacterium]